MTFEQRRAEAEALLREKAFARAIEALRDLLIEQDDPELRTTLADAYGQSGEPERAFHHYVRAANNFALARRSSAALRALEAAHRLVPDQPEVLFRMAQCLRTAGRTEELTHVLSALRHVARSPRDPRRLFALKELSALWPEDRSLKRERAEALAEVGQTDEAVALYQQLARNVNRGDDAVELLRRAATLAEGRPDLGAALAERVLEMGRARDALGLLVSFYERATEHVGVLEVLVRILKTLDAREKIIPARIELARARAKQGAFSEALADAEALLADFAAHPPVLEAVAELYGALGAEEPARLTWRLLAQVAAERGLHGERDRAVLALLRLDADDELALSLGEKSLRESGLEAEASALAARRLEVERRRRATEAIEAIEVEVEDWSFDDPSPTLIISDDDLLAVRAVDAPIAARIAAPLGAWRDGEAETVVPGPFGADQRRFDDAPATVLAQHRGHLRGFRDPVPPSISDAQTEHEDEFPAALLPRALTPLSPREEPGPARIRPRRPIPPPPRGPTTESRPIVRLAPGSARADIRETGFAKPPQNRGPITRRRAPSSRDENSPPSPTPARPDGRWRAPSEKRDTGAGRLPAERASGRASSANIGPARRHSPTKASPLIADLLDEPS